MDYDELVAKLDEARKAAKDGRREAANALYHEVLQMLEDRLKKCSGDWHQLEYLTTKAEFLTLGVWGLEAGEDYDVLRGRAVEILDLLQKSIEIAQKSNLEFVEQLTKKLDLILRETILRFGCVVPENKTHYVLKCPIRIREEWSKTGMGFGFSPGIIYKNPRCWECGKAILDPQCDHLPSKIVYDDFEVDHIAIVHRPKDPRCGIEELKMPKGWILNRLSEEHQAMKDSGNPLICNLCTVKGIEPEEITYDLFKKMQMVDDPNEVIEGEALILGGVVMTLDELKVDQAKPDEDGQN